MGTAGDVTSAHDHDDLDTAPGAAGTGGAGPMSTGPGAGAGPGGPEPAAGEPDGDPSLLGEEEAGPLGTPGETLTDPTEGAAGDDVWPAGTDASAEVDADDIPE